MMFRASLNGPTKPSNHTVVHKLPNDLRRSWRKRSSRKAESCWRESCSMHTAERIPEGLFVRKVCLQCAPQTQQCEGQDAGTVMVLIERDGWGFRRRDRGKGKGLAGGVLNGRWTVFFWRHGEHTSSDVAIAPDCLQ